MGNKKLSIKHNSPSRTITVSITERATAQIDALVYQGYFMSRSEFVRMATNEYLIKCKDLDKEIPKYPPLMDVRGQIVSNIWKGKETPPLGNVFRTEAQQP